MKKMFINLAITVAITVLIILIFSFIMWNIQWITSNSFFPLMGRLFSLIMGILICAAINDCKKNN